MKKLATRLNFLLLTVALAFVGGCSSSTEGFDTGDITITGLTASIDGSNVVWSATLTSVASETANVDIQVMLRVPGSTTFFYTSPRHSETLGGHETKTFAYTDTGVSLPAGASSYEAQISISALPD